MDAFTEHVLRKNGNELARHSTRYAAMVEAFERRLVVQTPRGQSLALGVTVTEEPKRSAGGCDA